MIARGLCRLILGCILVAVGGAVSVAQSPVAPTKSLTTPGLSQPLLVPPAITPKNSPSPAGTGLGLGAQTVPGISPVTNPQASKGGSDAEKTDDTRVTIRAFDRLHRLTRGDKADAVTRSPEKSKSTEQKSWLPSNLGKTGTGILGGNAKVEGMKPVVVTPIIPLTDTIKKRKATFHEQLANAAACRNECDLIYSWCDSASCNELTNCYHRCQGYISSR